MSDAATVCPETTLLSRAQTTASLHLMLQASQAHPIHFTPEMAEALRLLFERVTGSPHPLLGAAATPDLSPQDVRAAYQAQRREWNAKLRSAPSIDTIKRLCAAEFGVSVLDMESDRRDVGVLRARRVAIYLARTLTRHSLNVIGLNFGGRDHATIRTSVTRIEAMMRGQDPIAQRVRELIRLLTQDRETQGPAHD